MSQNYTINSYLSSRALQADLQLFENNFECLRTMFAGTVDPVNNVIGDAGDKLIPGMPWLDTTNKILKIRNAADSGWLGVMHGNTSMKIYMYKNSGTLGWTVDSSIGDKVLAFKGGSNDYNTTGGTVSGSWTQPDCILTEQQIPQHDHGSAGAHTHNFYVRGGGAWRYVQYDIYYNYFQWISTLSTTGAHTHSNFGKSSVDPHHHGDTYRPYAAVGTLQYINV